MHTLTLYSVIQNAGDGSAFARFFSSEALAQWHEDSEEEGWGESSIDSLTFTSESSISCQINVYTPITYLKDNLLWRGIAGRKLANLNDFIDTFFEGKWPEEVGADPRS